MGLCARLVLATALTSARAHEYMHVPPARTGSCLLNGVIMGSKICQTLKPGDDMQCLDDRLMYTHLFHWHPAYDRNACGGSTRVVGLRGGSQGILQECGDINSDPTQFNMSLPGPTPTFVAGAEAELTVKGFFHQGVMRMALCYTDDSDCSSPEHFNTYVLGYHFTEGTATNASSPDGIYGVVMPFNVRMPRRTGHAVLQWLVAAEDVRAYVSCSTVEIVAAHGAPPTATGTDTAWTCNGHPLCNCTTHGAPTAGGVGLGLTCPQGVAASVVNGSATGTDIVKQYKEQVGVEVFCELCISNGCPSTCGGIYNGFYQGPKCTNQPVLSGCSGAPHASALPKYIECTESTCLSSGWAPSPAPAPQPVPTPSPSPAPAPEPGRRYCAGNACKSGWIFKTAQCPAARPALSCWNSDDNYKCCASHV